MLVNVNLFLWIGSQKKKDSILPHVVLRISFTKLIKKMKIGRKKIFDHFACKNILRIK